MKKRYSTYAGVISGIILIALFFSIFIIKSPLLFFIPVITVDPITDLNVGEDNILILTGKTNLPKNTIIYTNVYPTGSCLSDGENYGPLVRGNAQIMGKSAEWNVWNGTLNISSLEPGSYTVLFTTAHYTDNFTNRVESGPIGSIPFTIGNETCIGDCIKKKTQEELPFIRINQISKRSKVPLITGITNLEPGVVMQWVIQKIPGTTKEHIFEGNCTIKTGINGINRWSVTHLPEMGSGRYEITVTASLHEKGQRIGKKTISAHMELNLTESREDMILPVEKEDISEILQNPYITIDALPEMNTSETYYISGTSNLPSGEVLLIEIIPPKGLQDYTFTINPRDSSQQGSISGLSGCVQIENGSEGINLWAFEIQTHLLTPGEYEITVSNTGLVNGSMELIPPTASSSQSFILNGGSL